MKKHYLNFLLITSLLFNLTFIGFFIYRSIEFERHERFNRMMPPPPEMKRELKRFKEQNPEMENNRLKNFEMRKNFFELLSQEKPDYQEIKTIADSLILTQYHIEKNITYHFIEARQKMTSYEAKEFFRQLTHHAENGCMRIKEKQSRRSK